MDKQLRSQVVFHLTGRHAQGADAAAAVAGMRPALMAAHRRLDELRYDFPVVFTAAGDAFVQSLSSIVETALRTVAPAGVAGLLLQAVAPVGSFLLFVAGTVLVFRYVPAKHVPWRTLLLPAILVGVTLAGFAQLYAFFAPLLTRMAAIYGTFVAFFAILAWLSISFNVLLFGACWTRVREQAGSGAQAEGPDEPPGDPAPGSTGSA